MRECKRSIQKMERFFNLFLKTSTAEHAQVFPDLSENAKSLVQVALTVCR